MRAQIRGFSLIELVFVIILVGALSSIAIFKLDSSVTYHACVRQISVNLEHFQLALAREISQNYYLKKSTSQDLRAIFAPFALSGKCSLMLDSKNLIARYQEGSTEFEISPQDLKASPRISCKMKDKLCRDIKGRLKEQ